MSLLHNFLSNNTFNIFWVNFICLIRKPQFITLGCGCWHCLCTEDFLFIPRQPTLKSQMGATFITCFFFPQKVWQSSFQRIHILLLGKVVNWPVYCSVTKLCLTLCDPMDCSMPGFPVLHHLPVCSHSCPLNWWCHPTVSSFITPFFSSLQSFSPDLNLAKHLGLFQWLGSSYQVTKVLVLQLQHQSFQWIFRIDFL